MSKYSSNSMRNCSVCNSTSASYHFGAIVCRACAIFFRRFVNRKRINVYCTCFLEKESPNQCRSCRMEKCLAVGMQSDQIHGPRDVIGNPKTMKMIGGPNSSSTPPENIYNLRIEPGICYRHLDRIHCTTENYRNLENTRLSVFNKHPNASKELDVHEFSIEIMTDIKLIWRLCETTFPEFNALCQQDKINQIFGPYWAYRYENVNNPLVAMGFDETENMALLGILLWDPGYTNISESLAETCHAMRKIIFRELNSCYESSEDETTSRNFFSILDSLSLIERAEQKCREEIHLCGVHKIEFDQERKNMILWDKN
ncbi:hypothetical protein CRE_18738 [Caenorhabditis remanei]|uniref:Nuclear receptor domain-containing protein n=1 Tax=Caenorhabditis remanei TaxID=31234 RepID=E3LJQ7_CAERE|nr:hypothetical protein CRE_18738 [Caenorhabditis remanei]